MYGRSYLLWFSVIPGINIMVGYSSEALAADHDFLIQFS